MTDTPAPSEGMDLLAAAMRRVFVETCEEEEAGAPVDAEASDDED